MQKNWQELAARLFCFLFFIVLGYVCLRYLLYVLLPIVLALVIGAGIYRLSKGLSRLTGVPRRLCAFFITSIIFILVGAVVFFVCRHLTIELARIISVVSRNHGDNVLEPLKRLPAVGALMEMYFTEDAKLRLTDLLVGLIDAVRPVLGKILKGSPTVLLSVAVTVISTYYVSMDTECLTELARSLAPRAYREDLEMLKDSVLFCTVGYLRSYTWLFLLTFFETLLALLLLKPSYACIGAICVAAVDILPIFGAGFILIPWGILSIVMGDVLSGVGLIVAYIIITVVRQIVEPKIVGESLGVHPFLVLVGTFVGARAFGILGMLFAPAVISIAFHVIKKESDFKAAFKK